MCLRNFYRYSCGCKDEMIITECKDKGTSKCIKSGYDYEVGIKCPRHRGVA
jgi:hypothetical protein